MDATVSALPTPLPLGFRRPAPCCSHPQSHQGHQLPLVGRVPLVPLAFLSAGITREYEPATGCPGRVVVQGSPDGGVTLRCQHVWDALQVSLVIWRVQVVPVLDPEDGPRQPPEPRRRSHIRLLCPRGPLGTRPRPRGPCRGRPPRAGIRRCDVWRPALLRPWVSIATAATGPAVKVNCNRGSSAREESGFVRPARLARYSSTTAADQKEVVELGIV